MPQTKIVFFDIDGTLIDMHLLLRTLPSLPGTHKIGTKLEVFRELTKCISCFNNLKFDNYLVIRLFFEGTNCYLKRHILYPIASNFSP